MFCGFFGMVNSFDGHYQTAAVAILASCLFDILDGKPHKLVKILLKNPRLATLVKYIK